jgi:hypothetical protein
MMKRLLKLMLPIIALLVINIPVTVGAANVLDQACNSGATASTSCKDRSTQTTQNNSIYGPNGILTKAARIVALLVGIASVIMIIIGGLRYVMASGDPNSINGAKNSIIYAIVGLIVALVATGIIQFVLDRL